MSTSLLVEVRVHRIICEEHDRFEVVFAYGDATEGEVKMPDRLDNQLAFMAGYFARKCGDSKSDMIYYDYKKNVYYTDLKRLESTSRMFYRAYCEDEEALKGVLRDIHFGRLNDDLTGKIVIMWAGELSVISDKCTLPGDRIALV